MKLIRMAIHKEYDVEINDNEHKESAFAKLEQRLAESNQTASNEFWGNLHVACRECGIILNLDEEKDDGICVSCDNK